MLTTERSYVPDKKNRKAAFSVAWMKLLGNFIHGKSSQERLIVERFLVGQRFEDELVHAVLSVLHEMVYTKLRSHIQSRKSPTGTSETFASRLSPDWPGNLTERQLQTKDPR